MNPTQLLEVALAPLAALDLTAIYHLERFRRRESDGRLVELLPPEQAPLDLSEWVNLYRGLFGMAAPWWRRALVGQPWLSLELHGEGGRVSARCWVPRRLEPMVRLHLTTALPGVEMIPIETEVPLPEPAVRARLSLWRDPLYPLGEPKADALRTVVSTLAAADHGVLQIVISPDVDWQRRALRQLDQLSGTRSPGLVRGTLGELLDIFAPVHTAGPADKLPPPPSAKLQMPPTDKALVPCYRAELRLRAAAPTKSQAKALMHALTSAFRGLDGSNALRSRRVFRGHGFDQALMGRSAPGRNSTVLSAAELAHLLHLPVHNPSLVAAPVRVAPGRFTPGPGKVLCVAEDGRATEMTLTQPDARHHTGINGPTGCGKSVLMANLYLADAAAEVGAGVIDPKGDLARDLLERIPEDAVDRIVLIDPSRRDWPVGINLLECEDPEDHELVCDSVVTIFRKTFERYWGPRTDDVMRAAVLTLLHRPGSTLCDIPSLLIQPDRWRRHIDRFKRDDPVGLGPFWTEYSRLSESQRLTTVGPVLNKLRSILLRPTVRNILGQQHSTIDFGAILDQRRLLVVALPKGLLGEETSRLLGSFVVARIWQAAQARAARPEAERPDFNLYLDEFQDYLSVPVSIDDVLVQARAYHLCLFMANQHLGQLNQSTREALSGNIHTRVVFQCGQEDARYLAREFEPLSDRDLRNLQRFQVAVRLCVDGRTQAPFTGITRPLPAGRGAEYADWVASCAVQRHGRPRDVVEAEILQSFRAGGDGDPV